LAEPSSDLEAVREQLGRDPDIAFTVVARCVAGGDHPLVIRNHPLDPEGRPFPTLYWLTCPTAVRRISAIESEGWIGRLNDRIEVDAAFAEAVDRGHRAYARERGRIVAGAEAWGGVGGTRVGIKCLHAHYAHFAAGGDDTVGVWVADRVEPIHGRSDGAAVAQPGPPR
jgi:hypothetical protein